MENRLPTEPQMKKEETPMKPANTVSRPCTIADSIAASCKEVRKMREGKLPEKSLEQLFSDIKQWCKEGGE